VWYSLWCWQCSSALFCDFGAGVHKKFLSSVLEIIIDVIMCYSILSFFPFRFPYVKEDEVLVWFNEYYSIPWLNNVFASSSKSVQFSVCSVNLGARLWDFQNCILLSFIWVLHERMLLSHLLVQFLYTFYDFCCRNISPQWDDNPFVEPLKPPLKLPPPSVSAQCPDQSTKQKLKPSWASEL